MCIIKSKGEEKGEESHSESAVPMNVQPHEPWEAAQYRA